MQTIPNHTDELHILSDMPMTETDVDVGEDFPAWIVKGIVEALHKEEPEFSCQSQNNKPGTQERCSHPDEKEAQHPARQTVGKGQDTTEYQRQQRVRSISRVVENSFGEVVGTLGATNGWRFTNHIWETHLNKIVMVFWVPVFIFKGICKNRLARGFSKHFDTEELNNGLPVLTDCST